MTNTNFEYIREMLVKQYSKLDNLSYDKMIEKLESVDFRDEFLKLKKQSRIYKIVLIICAILSIGLFLFKLLTVKNSIYQCSVDLLQAFFAIAFIVITFQNLLNKVSLKIRLLGILYEFYKK